MASRLQDVLLRGLAAARPLATAVAIGTLYFSTDTGVTEQSDGTNWNSYSGAGGTVTSSTTVDPAGLLLAGEIPEESNVKIQGLPGIPYNHKIRTIGITVDGGGSAVTTGVKGYFAVPFDATIIGNRVLADAAGSIVFDVWKDTFANYPPTVADTITAAAKPTLAAVDHSEDNTLTGWTKSIKAGDVIGYNVDSAATVTRVTLELVLLLD